MFVCMCIFEMTCCCCCRDTKYSRVGSMCRLGVGITFLQSVIGGRARESCMADAWLHAFWCGGVVCAEQRRHVVRTAIRRAEQDYFRLMLRG